MASTDGSAFESSGFFSTAVFGKGDGTVDVSGGAVDVARSIALERDGLGSLQPTAVSAARTMGMVNLRLMFMEPPAP
ncbi:MAG: hypothetical protein JRJ10_09010 [Deltaproteobacteria bacterium]|nr:hypothetical protein [Deltaproteobacteria bacterium]